MTVQVASATNTDHPQSATNVNGMILTSKDISSTGSDLVYPAPSICQCVALLFLQGLARLGWHRSYHENFPCPPCLYARGQQRYTRKASV